MKKYSNFVNIILQRFASASWAALQIQHRRVTIFAKYWQGVIDWSIPIYVNGVIAIVVYASPMLPLRCSIPPHHLRSEVSFSRTCNIPYLISYIYHIAFLTLHQLCGYMVHQLCGYMVAQLDTHLKKYLLSAKFS